jgi:hypothetical protein
MRNTIQPLFRHFLALQQQEMSCPGVYRAWSSRRRKTMRTTLRRFAVAALAGIIAFSAIGLTPAEARHWRRGDAAVLGAVAGIFGTIAVLAARDRYRDDYYGCYGCGGPYYGGPGPYAYAPGYRYDGWHHHWHH